MAAMREDRAEVFAFMMLRSPLLNDACKSDSILQAKVDRMKQLIQGLEPEMNESFWSGAETAAAVKPQSARPVPVVSDVFVCSREVDAFHPDNPSQQIGRFLMGSRLQIGAADPSGKLSVTFVEPDGVAVHALCRPEDVGR